MGTKTQRLRRSAVTTLGVLLGALTLFTNQALNAQTSADTFDIDRFSNAGVGWFETFYVDEMLSLQSLLDEGIVSEDAAVLVTEIADGQLAMLTDQMAFHHIAQGSVDGKDWMATF